MKNLMIFPMAFYVFYMFIMLIVMFRSRVSAIKSKNVSLGYFRTYDRGDKLPEYVIAAGRHYDNQFQVPLLFLITCLSHLVIDKIDMLSLTLAWVFVLSRVGHSYIHLGTNNVRHRLYFFAIGWLAIVLMWVQLLYLEK